MLTVEELVARVTAETSEFKAGMAEVESTTSRVGKGAGIAGLAIAAGLAYGADKAIDAAEDAQTSTARMGAAFTAAHVPIGQFTSAIEGAESAGRKLGFQNDETKTAIGSLVVATHSGAAAVKDLAVAEDLARFKHESLASATKSITMAMTGSSRAAKQLGITIIPVTTNVDALAAKSKFASTQAYSLAHAHAELLDKMATAKEVIARTTELVHGQADAFASTAAGGMAAFHAQVNNLEEGLGAGLLPALTAVTGALSRGATYLSEHKTLAKDLVIGIAALAAGLLTLSAATWAVNTAMAANPVGLVVIAVVALTAAVVVAYKESATFREVVGKAFTDVKQIVGDVVAGVKNDIAELTSWWRAHEALIMDDVHIVWDAIKAVFMAVLPIIETYVKTVFENIKIIVTTAINAIKDVIQLVLDLIHGNWSAAWNDIKDLTRTLLNGIVAFIENTLHGLVTIAGQAMQLVGRALWDGLKAGAALLEQLGAWIMGKITTAIDAVAAWALGEAEKIGKAIAEGVIKGITGLGSDVSHAVTSTLSDAYHAATGFLHINSPSLLFAQGVGSPMGEGVIVGWLQGIAPLPDQMSSALRTAMNAAIQQVQNARQSFQTAWDALAQDADTAFDGIKAAIQTKTEKLITEQQAAHAAQQLSQALTSAQQGLATAQAGTNGVVDPAAVLAAQQQLADAQYDIQQAAEAKQAAAERKQLDAKNTLEKTHFDAALTALKQHLSATGATEKESQDAIIKLFKSYGVTYKASAAALGDSFVVGLKEKVATVEKQGEDLGKSIADGIKVGIANGAQAISDAATAAADKALNAAKAKLGIKSPSQVFADEVGGPISQGIAQGITAASGDMLDSLKSAVGGLTGVQIPDLSANGKLALTSSVNGALAAGALGSQGQTAGTTLNVHFDGSTVIASDRAQMRQFALALSELLPQVAPA